MTKAGLKRHQRAVMQVVDRVKVQKLMAERALILPLVTTNDDEYRSKWTRINELTNQIAEANGGIDAKVRSY